MSTSLKVRGTDALKRGGLGVVPALLVIVLVVASVNVWPGAAPGLAVVNDCGMNVGLRVYDDENGWYEDPGRGTLPVILAPGEARFFDELTLRNGVVTLSTRGPQFLHGSHVAIPVDALVDIEVYSGLVQRGVVMSGEVCPPGHVVQFTNPCEFDVVATVNYLDHDNLARSVAVDLQREESTEYATIPLAAGEHTVRVDIADGYDLRVLGGYQVPMDLAQGTLMGSGGYRFESEFPHEFCVDG